MVVDLLVRWFRRQRTKPIMEIKKEPIQPLQIDKRIQQLEKEKGTLRLELWKHKRKPSRLAGHILLLLGATAFATSIVYASSVLAFIGLGLTFWGIVRYFLEKKKKFIGRRLNPKPTTIKVAELMLTNYSLWCSERGFYHR